MKLKKLLILTVLFTAKIYSSDAARSGHLINFKVTCNYIKHNPDLTTEDKINAIKSELTAARSSVDKLDQTTIHGLTTFASQTITELNRGAIQASSKLLTFK